MYAHLGTVYSSSVWDLSPTSLCGFRYFLHSNIIPEYEILHLETVFPGL